MGYLLYCWQFYAHLCYLILFLIIFKYDDKCFFDIILILDMGNKKKKGDKKGDNAPAAKPQETETTMATEEDTNREDIKPENAAENVAVEKKVEEKK